MEMITIKTEQVQKLVAKIAAKQVELQEFKSAQDADSVKLASREISRLKAELNQALGLATAKSEKVETVGMVEFKKMAAKAQGGFMTTFKAARAAMQSVMQPFFSGLDWSKLTPAKLTELGIEVKPLKSGNYSPAAMRNAIGKALEVSGKLRVSVADFEQKMLEFEQAQEQAQIEAPEFEAAPF